MAPFLRLKIAGHGGPSSISLGGKVGGKGDEIDMDDRGEIITPSGENLTDAMNKGMAPNGTIYLNGCNTAWGNNNLAQKMSKSVPGRKVIGGAFFQARFPWDRNNAYGPKSAYTDGQLEQPQPSPPIPPGY